MVSLFDVAYRIFNEATEIISGGMYAAAQDIYDNTFFTTALTVSIVIFGVMAAFRKFDTETGAYQFLWIILVFAFVKTLLVNETLYEYGVWVVRAPFEIFMEAVAYVLSRVGMEASPQEVLDSIVTSNVHLLESVRAKGGWSDWFPFFFSAVIWLVGTFVTVVIIMMLLVSTFLAHLVLSLAPLIIPTLVWKKTQSVFFQWIRLYISLSLYAPFTLLFGVVLVEINTLILSSVEAIKEGGFNENIKFIFIVVILQVVTVLGIFRIPNIINQIIGSSNEGSSLSGSMGTASAGVTMLAGAAKYTGIQFAASQAVQKAPSAVGAAANARKRPRVIAEPH